MTIAAQALYRGPKLAICIRRETYGDSTDRRHVEVEGFISPWTEEQAEEARKYAPANRSFIPVAHWSNSKHPNYNLGTYVSDDFLRRSAVSAVNEGKKLPRRRWAPFEPSSTRRIIGAVVCRLAGLPEKTWKSQWDRAVNRYMIDMEDLCDQIKPYMLAGADIEEWWTVPLVRPLTVVRT